MIGDALIDVLVGSAQQRQLLTRRNRSASACEKPRPRGDNRTTEALSSGFHRLEERLGLHHHPRATAVRRVVDRAMLVVCEIATVTRL